MRSRATGLKLLLFRLGYKLSRNIPYGLGKKLRKITAGQLFARAGKHYSVGIGANFGDGSRIELSEYANLGPGFSLTGLGKVILGEHIMMGYECMFITTNHQALPGGGTERMNTKTYQLVVTFGSGIGLSFCRE